MENANLKDRLVIAVTGYTGNGKTFVSKRIQREIERSTSRSALILDADVMARQVRDESAEGKQRIIEALGAGVYGADGKSIPLEISRIIFGDGEESLRKRVLYESIFLDLVPKKVELVLNESPANSVVILDFFLISNYLRPIIDRIDFLVFVQCSPERQFERLVSPRFGRKIDEDTARRRIATQRSSDPEDRALPKADFVLSNETEEPDALDEQIRRLMAQLKLA